MESNRARARALLGGALSIADQGIVLNLGKVVMAADAVTLAADVGLRKHYLGF